eukprot:15331604-Alexandrium_andersonii.AAC.1
MTSCSRRGGGGLFAGPARWSPRPLWRVACRRAPSSGRIGAAGASPQRPSSATCWTAKQSC